jgi:NAD(P)-dependent dehydrogenase (short-subunit alcohol dehydrogenase family)
VSASSRNTALVLGVGPGLGMSVARRFGREGYAVALVSRSAARHDGYVASLADGGVDAAAFAADLTDRDQLHDTLAAVTRRFGGVDVAYYGPGGVDPEFHPREITEIDSDDVRSAFRWVYPAVDTVAALLPPMLERGDGGLLFAGGLSGQVPMPALGNLALSSAALRTYALTLNVALADRGVYAGALTIGGLIARGDIHRMVSSAPATYGDVGESVLDPDDIADAAWEMYTKRDRAESTFSAFG